MKTTIGGDVAVSETWKWSVTPGFLAPGGEKLIAKKKFGGSTSWSSIETKTFRQNIDITIEPGKKVSLSFPTLFYYFVLY